MVKTHPKSRLLLLTVEQIRDTNEVVLQAEKIGSQFVGSMKDAYLCEVVSQYDFRNAATIETVTAALLEEREENRRLRRKIDRLETELLKVRK